MLILGFVVAQIVLLIVIVLVLKRLIFSDTNSAINRLTKVDNMNREKERLLAQKLEQAQKYIEEQKKNILETEQKMKQESKRAANQLHEDIINKAKVEAEEIVKKAQATRDRMKAESMIEAESKVLDLCTEILGAILSNTVDSGLNVKLIDEFIAELEKADLSKVNVDSGQVELISAKAIDPAAQEKIKGVLTAKCKVAMDVTVNEDPKLVGGVKMTLGTMVVDASLSERIKDTAKDLKEKLNWKYTTD